MRLISQVNKLLREVSLLRWAVASFFCVVLVAGIIIYTNEHTVASQHERTDGDWSLIARSITTNDHTIGNISAPIQVIVYSDFECKYCKHLFSIDIPKLQAAFKDQIVIAFRHFPLKSQPGTQAEAEASECVYQAKGDDAFWKFAQNMFERNGVNGDMQALTQEASVLGVDTQTFTACMQQGSGKSRIEKDRLEASVAGIGITPSEILKSTHRALVIKGDYYSQLYSGVAYLLGTNKQIQQMIK